MFKVLNDIFDSLNTCYIQMIIFATIFIKKNGLMFCPVQKENRGTETLTQAINRGFVFVFLKPGEANQ